MTAKNRISWWLRWLASAGLLAWILTRPELARLGSELGRVNPLWVLGGLMCAGLSLGLGAWRWQACLQALGMDAPLGRVFKVSLAATAAGCFSFGALGTDLARVLLAGRHWPTSRGGVLTSLALDHASAVPCVVVMVAAAVLAHGVVPAMRMPGVWVMLGAVGFVGVAIGMVRWKFRRIQVEILRVLANQATWRGFGIAVWRSVPMWLAYCGVFYCAARAFGVVVPALGFAGVIAIADGVAALPITIAGLGLREQAFQSLLGAWYGVPPAAAVALSLTGFSLSLVWAAVGALCLGGVPVKSQVAIIP